MYITLSRKEQQEESLGNIIKHMSYYNNSTSGRKEETYRYIGTSPPPLVLDEGLIESFHFLFLSSS